MDQNQRAEEKKLFGDFPPVTREQWDEAIRGDLKGQDYDSRLIWKTGEGFNVKPFYLADDLEWMSHVNTFPDEFPFVRGHKTKNNEWFIRESVRVDDPGEANQQAGSLTGKGATSVNFILNEHQRYNDRDVDRLLDGLLTGKIELVFTGGEEAAAILPFIIRKIRKDSPPDMIVPVSIYFDPLGHLVVTGNFYHSAGVDFDRCKELIMNGSVLPHFRVITVGGHHFHHAGASLVEELAFSLSAGVEYLHQLTLRGLDAGVVAAAMTFNFAVGSNYFFEIARMRAARMLWAGIIRAYDHGDDKNAAMRIHATTSMWNMTFYDPYVNLLRSTTEAMSAILGGADSLAILPFDHVSGHPDDLSRDMALNQHLLLKEEASLNRVVDPAAGSYYLENLTYSIAVAAWDLFLSVEKQGGFLNAFRDGSIQTRIHATASARDMAIAQRKEILLGTNQYPDFTGNDAHPDTPDDLDKEEPPAGSTFATPLRLYRGAVAFERLRLRTDRYAAAHHRPAVFMLTYGNMAMRLARSQFAGNFFGCAGFTIINHSGFEKIRDGIEECLRSHAEIIVLCSSDTEYKDTVPEIFNSLKNDKIVVLAGYPADQVEHFRSLGMTHFIHARSDILETLEAFQKELHIMP
jgi:methylmalonyl-CoA mutase